MVISAGRDPPYKAKIKYFNILFDSSFRLRPESSGDATPNDALDTGVRRYDDQM